MPLLIETPEQELQMQLGALIWQTTVLRSDNTRLQKENDELKAQIEELQPKRKARAK